MFRIREAIRLSPIVSRTLYLIQNVVASWRGRLAKLPTPRNPDSHRVALCLRFRNEARYLAEWLDYHRAAGVSHFFLYNNFSDDGFETVLAPYLAAGGVTLIDWPRRPASPAAEEDCIKRAIGRFAWVGFLDADEFVVIKDGRSIPDYLASFPKAPGVALHWYYFGSNGHEGRPHAPVIEAYTRRNSLANRHVKCFVRPERVTQNRNPHCWFYRRADWAVDEVGRGVFGSIGTPRAETAWINHYYFKSFEDYLEKAKLKPTQDIVGMKYPSRLEEKARQAMAESNDVEDQSAVGYYRRRQQT